jgi:NPCBM/NEW2 domain-containing protein
MKKIALVLLIFLAATAAAQISAVPLLALWKARQGHENMIWMEQRVKVGGQSVSGYFQGTGGSDDALIAFQFEEEYDMLTATVGFKDTTPEGRKAEFSVEAGGKVIYSSGILESKGTCHDIRVPIRGYKNILFRISSDSYNGTAGGAFGSPTLLSGLSAEDMKNDWSLSINNRKTPLPGNNAPSSIPLNFDVPGSGVEAEYRVLIKRDTEGRTVVVEKERLDP